MLRLGTMPESFTPSEEIQRLRSIVHIRQGLVEERVRWKNCIWQYFGVLYTRSN